MRAGGDDRRASAGVAAVLAFFVPGLGHFFLGRFARGLAFMAAPVLIGAFLFVAASSPSAPDAAGAAATTSIAALVGAGVWLAQVMDAFACASPRPAASLRRARRGRRGRP